MDYRENVLNFQIYNDLRKSVEWSECSLEQVEKMIERTLYTVTVFDGEDAVGMGRLLGDGQYYLIVDVVVRPEYQYKKIGSHIINMILEYVERETVLGERASVQLISEKGKEEFYERFGFKQITHEFCGSGGEK